MTILFSQYLIEHKKVTVQHVVEAMVEQARLIPSLLEIITSQKLMNSVDLYQALSHQQIFDLEFRTSLEELGFWTPELAEKIFQYLQNIRKPLGEILVEKGFMTEEAITPILLSYVEIASHVSVVPAYKGAQKSPLVITPNTVLSKTSHESSDSEKANSTILKARENAFDEIEKYDSNLTNEYIFQFENKFLPNIQAIISSMQASYAKKNIFILLIKDAIVELNFQTIAAVNLGAKLSESILVEAIRILEVFNSADISVDSKGIVNVLQIVCRILDGICQYLKDFQTESIVNEDKNMKDLMDRFWKRSQKTETVFNLLLELKECDN